MGRKVRNKIALASDNSLAYFLVGSRLSQVARHAHAPFSANDSFKMCLFTFCLVVAIGFFFEVPYGLHVKFII